MPNKNEPVDIDPTKATPLEAGDPVEAQAITQMGGTFAERAKARAAAEKRVRGDDAEDKAVKASESKRAKKKS